MQLGSVEEVGWVGMIREVERIVVVPGGFAANDEQPADTVVLAACLELRLELDAGRVPEPHQHQRRGGQLVCPDRHAALHGGHPNPDDGRGLLVRHLPPVVEVDRDRSTLLDELYLCGWTGVRRQKPVEHWTSVAER